MLDKHLVKMPLKNYLSEHRKLTTLLDKTSAALKKESQKQKAEVSDQRRKMKALEPKSK
jgi:hypothetical protein